ncbi:MAG TPA: HAD-IA family hydrolase [Candidatus Acidoferrales bacterium]|nr:HAD-IA family hydrolase [Candidatus Acidoferrales bacterium]
MPEPNGQFSHVRFLIFDLDGTLIDSKLDLALSTNAMLGKMGCAPLPDETVFSYVGNGAAMLVRRALGESTATAQVEQALAYFLDYYREHMLDNTVTYPGVREALDALAGRPMAVLTNKPVIFSRAILDGLGLSGYFQRVYGGNSFEKKKPDPTGAQTLLREFGAAPREAMMIGDSDVDVRTARNAGIWSCGVTYGLCPATLSVYPPDVLLDSLEALPPLLKSR